MSFGEPIAWNCISTSADLIAVFVAVYGFLICGLVSIADTHFIHASHCQCGVASHAIVFSVAFRAPFGATSAALSVLAEVSACASGRARQFNPIPGLDECPVVRSIHDRSGRTRDARDNACTCRGGGAGRRPHTGGSPCREAKALKRRGR